MKKKLISAILIGATIPNLVACGTKENKNIAVDNSKVSISVQVEEAWLPYYEKVKETVLMENKDANIEFITVGSFDHLDILESTDPTNKDVADIFAFPADKTEGLAKNQTLSVLDAKGMAERIGGFTSFEEGLSASFKLDGEYWAFPYNIETLVGFVNCENANKAGIDITKNIEFTDLSYEQMLAIVYDAWFGVAFTNSVDFDYNSMYPNIIDSHNIAPNTIIGKLYINETASDLFNIINNETEKVISYSLTQQSSDDNDEFDIQSIDPVDNGRKFTEDYLTGNVAVIGNKWFGLPTIEELVELFDETE